MLLWKGWNEMNSQGRRKEIMRLLEETDGYITAQKMADKFGVTRQVIVSDIGVLRAGGSKIVAAKSGYCIDRADDGMITESIVCRHTAADTLKEFYIVLECGGVICNVIIEHPIYGQLGADLNIRSRSDADAFVLKAKASKASQLSELTDGLHIHTVKLPSQEAYEQLRERLSEEGILV